MNSRGLVKNGIVQCAGRALGQFVSQNRSQVVEVGRSQARSVIRTVESEGLISGSPALRAFVFRNSALTALGTLGGSVSSAAGINSAGHIVGYSTDSNEVSSGFLYDGSRMINLSDLIPAGSGFTNLASADAINDSGKIAGSGYLADGQFHAYLLTPIGTNAPPARFSLRSPGWGASTY